MDVRGITNPTLLLAKEYIVITPQSSPQSCNSIHVSHALWNLSLWCYTLKSAPRNTLGHCKTKFITVPGRGGTNRKWFFMYNYIEGRSCIFSDHSKISWVDFSSSVGERWVASRLPNIQIASPWLALQLPGLLPRGPKEFHDNKISFNCIASPQQERELKVQFSDEIGYDPIQKWVIKNGPAKYKPRLLCTSETCTPNIHKTCINAPTDNCVKERFIMAFLIKYRTLGYPSLSSHIPLGAFTRLPFGESSTRCIHLVRTLP